jgi:hypothetical protein
MRDAGYLFPDTGCLIPDNRYCLREDRTEKDHPFFIFSMPLLRFEPRPSRSKNGTGTGGVIYLFL